MKTIKTVVKASNKKKKSFQLIIVCSWILFSVVFSTTGWSFVLSRFNSLLVEGKFIKPMRWGFCYTWVQAILVSQLCVCVYIHIYISLPLSLSCFQFVGSTTIVGSGFSVFSPISLELHIYKQAIAVFLQLVTILLRK